MMKKLGDTLKISIDCYMEDQARQQDPGIYACIQELRLSGALTGSNKEVDMQPKGVKQQKVVDTNSTKVVSQSFKNL